MKGASFRGWLTLSGPQRAVLLDEVLERLPEGYAPLPTPGPEPSLAPRYVHLETGVSFHLVFGDQVLLGMSERRLDRLARVQRAARCGPGLAEEELDLPSPVPSADEVRAVTPARRVAVSTLLVGELLSALQLHRLGVGEALLSPLGVRPAGVGAALRGLTIQGWRLPSEAEWEFVARAAMDSLDDEAPPLRPALRFLPELGSGLELCRDSWHPTWQGAPEDAGAWGEGHEVLRGGGNGVLYTAWTAAPAWSECVLPSRRPVAGAPRTLGVRPVASLGPSR
jgi:hypothetical protein